LSNSNCHTVHTAHDAAPQDHNQPQPTHPGMYPIYYQLTTPSKPTQPVLAPPITDTRTP
jgi:hypothetical protein